MRDSAWILVEFLFVFVFVFKVGPARFSDVEDERKKGKSQGTPHSFGSEKT